MRKLLIQPQARLDLLEIWHHIANDDLDAANQVGKAGSGNRMLLDIAGTLQQILADRIDPATVQARWTESETQIHDSGLRRRRRNIILAFTIVFGFIALIVFIGFMASRDS